MYFIYKYIQFVVLSSIKWRDVNMTRYTFRLVLVLKIVHIKRQKQKQTNKWKWWECSFGNPLPVLTNQKSKTATATYELILRCHFWTSLFLEQFALLDLEFSLLYIILCPFSFKHCIVSPSPIYRYWFPIWHLQIFLTMYASKLLLLSTQVIGPQTVCPYPLDNYLHSL